MLSLFKEEEAPLFRCCLPIPESAKQTPQLSGLYSGPRLKALGRAVRFHDTRYTL